MNLLKMSKKERMDEIRKAKNQMNERRMGNGPLTDGADYLGFIIEGYETTPEYESERKKAGHVQA